ncbi:MAG: hypothetical protein ACI9SE_001235 [Neolewinella sp.]|jgi:hypothetical protein
MSMIACDACDAFNSSKASVCIECGEPLGDGVAKRSAPGPVAVEPPSLQMPRAASPSPPPLPVSGKPADRRVAGSRASSRSVTGRNASGSGATSSNARPSQGRASRRQRDPVEVERSRQRQEFGRIKNIVFTVRSVYWSGVLFAVTQLLLYHLILLPAFVEQELMALAVIVGVISWGQLALLIAGAKLVMGKPYVWTIVGAAYWSLGTAQAFWIASLADWALLQDTRFVAYLTMMAFMLVAFWFAVAQAKRVQRLMDSNPDLQLQRKRLDPEERSTGGIAEEASARRGKERSRSHAMQFRLIMVAVGVLLLGSGGVWAMTRPPSPAGAAATFQELWTAGDLDQIYLLCIGGKSGATGSTLREGMQQRGWERQPPKLDDVVVDGSEKRATSLFSCDAGELGVLWRLSDRGWRISSTSLPDLVVGDVNEGVAAFRKAWASSGSDALMAMIRTEDYRIETGVSNILKGREWVESRPALGDVDVGEVRSRGRVTTTFALGEKELRITLRYWHPGWKIAGLSLR